MTFFILKDIQARLGHSTIAVTGDLYARLTDQRQKDIAARFDDALADGRLESPVTIS